MCRLQTHVSGRCRWWGRSHPAPAPTAHWPRTWSLESDGTVPQRSSPSPGTRTPALLKTRQRSWSQIIKSKSPFFYLLQCLFLTVLGVSICQFKSRNTALGLGPRHGHRVLGHMTKNQVWGRLWTWCSTFTGYIWTSRLHNKSDVQQDVLMRLNIIWWEDILDHHIRSMSVCIYVQTHIYTVYTPYTT